MYKYEFLHWWSQSIHTFLNVLNWTKFFLDLKGFFLIEGLI